MRAQRAMVVLGVTVVAGVLPATSSAFPGQGSCAGEGAFVSGNAQQFGAGFGQLVSSTARTETGLADVIQASHAANCEPRP
jgi:hypothetical protein